MSWLPSGLTSITGQITSFTKEVLSEGADEIDDHVTELRVAKASIKELELTCSTQRSELDRVKLFIDELSVQLQSKELQMQSLARDHRTTMELKEKEVLELKQQHAELCEKFSTSSFLLPDQVAQIPNVAKASHSREYGESIDDFHDVISSQHEINHLRNEVRRLEAEVGHWRRSSDAQSKAEDGTSSAESGLIVPQLQSQITDLQRQLADEIDRHQHELSALQDAHRLTTSALKKSHKTAIDQLQLKKSETDQLGNSFEDLRKRLEHLDEKNAKLESDLEIAKAASCEKSEDMKELERRLDEANSEIEKLVEERQVIRLKYEAVNKEFGALSKDRDEMVEQLNNCGLRLRQQEQELNQMRAARIVDSQAASAGFMSSTPVAPSRLRLRSDDLKASFIDDSMNFEELSVRNQFLDDQVKTLQSQIEKYEQELEQFDLVRSDWQMEKQALEGVLKKLRDQLREKEGELSIVQARKGLLETKQLDANLTLASNDKVIYASGYVIDADDVDDDDDDDDDIKVHAQKLDHQVGLLANENAHLEADRDRLEIDKEQLIVELEQEQQTVKRLQQELEDLNDSTSRRLADLEAKLLQKADEYSSVEGQLSAKDLKINELTRQLDAALPEFRRAEATDKLEAVSSEKRDFGSLENQLELLRQTVKNLESEKDAVLEESRLEMEMLQMEKQALEESMEELDASHLEAVNQVIKSRGEVLQANETLKQQIRQMEQQLFEKENHEELLIKKIQENEEEMRRYMEDRTASRRRMKEAEAENAKLQEALAANAMKLKELQTMSAAQFEELKASQSAEVLKLADYTSQLEQERKEMLDKLRHLETGNSSPLPESRSTLEEQVEQLRSDLESSKLHVASLTKDFAAVKTSLTTKEEEAESLAVQVEALRLENSSKSSDKTEIRELQEQCTDLQQQLLQRTSSLQQSERAKKELVQMQRQLEKERDGFREEAKRFKETCDEMESISKLYEEEVKRLTLVEDEHLILSGRYKSLEAKVEELEKLATPDIENPHDSTMMQEKYSLTEENQWGESVEQYKNLVDELEKKVQTLELEISELREKSEMKRVVEGRETSLDCIDSQEVLPSDLNRDKVLDGSFPSYDTNGKHIKVWKSPSDDDVLRLKTTVSQQEDLIKTLNSKYSSMLRLLEDRSMSSYGSTVLADVHRLESEVQSLRAEKEHMMSVLSEKTREASSLKGEVHRLMSAVSAGKTALTKLQQDTQDMARNQEMSNMDMKKEAIKKLSQLVKDRDIEIEALKEKNATLVQVLQSTSADGKMHQISMLIQERDDLQGQVAAYQNDREQIINTLNIKHQESVSYYEEVERLTSLVADLTEQRDKLERNFSSLSSQYEDKQKSLFKALNELTNYKQKLVEMETRYNERLQNGSGSPDISMPKSPNASPLLDGETPNAVSMKQGFDKALAERDGKMAELGRNLDEHIRLLHEKEQLLGSKEQEVSTLTVKLHLSEANVSAKESELGSVRKQCENLTFQMQGLTDERTELTGELDQLRRRCDSLAADTQVVRQANSAMTISINNKDLEINTLQEKVRSLENVVQQHGENSSDGDHAEVEHLKREIELLRNQGLLLQQDRNQLYLAIHQFQAENTELKNEMVRLQEKEQRLAKECDRLRGHLLVIEDGHTREALESEEREKELRNRLAAVEEKALSSSAAVVSARSDASRQVENLQLQLYAIAEQRDNALLQLANAQETITSYASSLTNLQLVLEQFQADRQHQQLVEIERYKKNLDAERDENQRLMSQLEELHRQLEETLEALAAAERLSEQLDKKEGMINALREEVILRENELSKAEAELRKLTTSTEAKVDKVIVKNLFLGYFHAPASKRSEALQVIGHILSFSKEDMQEMARSSSDSGSWIGGLFRKKSTPLTSSQNPSQNLNQSFSALFVKFLERESTPQPEMRLPAELMVQEQQERRQHQRVPAFNPFSIPLESSVPLTFPSLGDPYYQSPLLSGASTASHILLGPMSSSHLPVFTPATLRADTPVQGRDSSAASSGRSTPSGSGAILRDILQQR